MSLHAITRSQQIFDQEPFHRWALGENRDWLEFYRFSNIYVLRFPELADFEVSLDGKSIICFPTPGVTEATYRHLFVNQVLPLARSCSGQLVFHASAIESNVGAVAFLGVSGRGKSTLAASFAGQGLRFLTDDALYVEKAGSQYNVTPGDSSIRLWEDSAEIVNNARRAEAVSYTSKAKFLATRHLPHCRDKLPLKVAYFLGDGKDKTLKIDRLSPSESLMSWVRHSFLLDVDDSRLIRAQFTQIADMLDAVPSFSIDYPREYDRLPDVRLAILEHVQRVVHQNEPKRST